MTVKETIEELFYLHGPRPPHLSVFELMGLRQVLEEALE